MYAMNSIVYKAYAGLSSLCCILMQRVVLHWNLNSGQVMELTIEAYFLNLLKIVVDIVMFIIWDLWLFVLKSAYTKHGHQLCQLRRNQLCLYSLPWLLVRQRGSSLDEPYNRPFSFRLLIKDPHELVPEMVNVTSENPSARGRVSAYLVPPERFYHSFDTAAPQL